MESFAETDRWYMREILAEDADAFFKMDSKPAVHRYLGNKPMKSKADALEAINIIRAQYDDYGIGRWAVINKETQRFIGWSGLKYEKSHFEKNSRFYDIGYRLHPDFWAMGYATETAVAAMDHAFNIMKIKELGATAHCQNEASNHILSKIGMIKQKSISKYGLKCFWYTMSHEDYLKRS